MGRNAFANYDAWKTASPDDDEDWYDNDEDAEAEDINPFDGTDDVDFDPPLDEALCWGGMEVPKESKF